MVSIVKYGQEIDLSKIVAVNGKKSLTLDNLVLNNTIKIKIPTGTKYVSELVEDDLKIEFTDEEGNILELILKDMTALLAQNDGFTLVEMTSVLPSGMESIVGSITDLASATQAAAAGPGQQNTNSDSASTPDDVEDETEEENNNENAGIANAIVVEESEEATLAGDNNEDDTQNQATDRNNAPSITPIATQTIDEDNGSITIAFTATDIDGDTLSSSVTAANGTVSIAGNDITYIPNQDYNGTDTITLTVTDGNGGTTTQVINVTVNPVNDAPVIETIATQTVDEDNEKTITFTATDVDGDTLNSSVTATNGTATVLGNVITFTPNTNYNGPATVTLTVDDGNGEIVSQVINVTVNELNDAPVITPIATQTVDEDNIKTITFTATDAENDTLNSSVTATNGTAIINTNGDIEFTPTADFNGDATVTLTVVDINGGTTTQVINVTVNPVNDAPTVSSETITDAISEDALTAADSTLLESVSVDINATDFSFVISNSTIVSLFDSLNLESQIKSAISSALSTVSQDDIDVSITKVDDTLTIDASIPDYSGPAPLSEIMTQENLNIVLLDHLGTAFNLPFENAVYEGQITISDVDTNDTHTLSLGDVRLEVTSSNKYLITLFEQLSGTDSALSLSYIKDLASDLLSGTTESSTVDEEIIQVPTNGVQILQTAGLLTISLDDNGEYKVVSPLFNTMKETDSIEISFDYTANDGTVDSNTGTTTFTVVGVNDIPVAIEQTSTVGTIENGSTSYDGALPGSYIYKMFKTVNENIDTSNGISNIVDITELQTALLDSVLGNGVDISVDDIDAFALYNTMKEFQNSLPLTVAKVVAIIERDAADTSKTTQLSQLVNTLLIDYGKADASAKNTLLTDFAIDVSTLFANQNNLVENIDENNDLTDFAESVSSLPSQLANDLLSVIGVDSIEYATEHTIDAYASSFSTLNTKVATFISQAPDFTNEELTSGIKDLIDDIKDLFILKPEEIIEADYLLELLDNFDALETLVTLDPQSLLDVDALLTELGIDLNNLDINGILATVLSDVVTFAKDITLSDLANDPDGIKTFFKDSLDVAFESVDTVLDDVLNNKTTEELKEAINISLTNAILDELGDNTLYDLILETVERLTEEPLQDVSIENLKSSALENIFEQVGLDKGFLEEDSRDVIAENMVQDLYDRLSMDEDLSDIATLNYFIDDSVDVVTIVRDENGDIVENAVTAETTVTIDSSKNDGIYTITNSDFDDLSSLWTVEVSFNYFLNNGSDASNSNSVPVTVSLDIADNIINSTVSDGYISNATVFADANNDGIWNEGEAKTTTDAKGDFTLIGGSGPLVVTGGTDISTGLAFEGTFTAPEGSEMVTPLTTLVAELLNKDGNTLSLEEATALVKSSLGIDSSVDILNFDPLETISNEDASDAEKELALEVQSVAVQIVNIMSQTAQAVEKTTDGEVSEEEASLQAIDSILDIIVRDETIDLTNTSNIEEVMQTVQDDNGIVFEDKQDIVDVTTNINKAMDNADGFERLAQIQMVAEDIENDIEDNGLIETVYSEVEIDDLAKLKTIGNVIVEEALAAPIIQEADLLDSPTINSVYSGVLNSIENAETYSFANGVVLTFTNNTNELYEAINAITNANSLVMNIDEVTLVQLDAAELLSIEVNTDGTYTVSSKSFTKLDNSDDIDIAFNYTGTAEDLTVSAEIPVTLTVIGKNFAPTLEIANQNITLDEDGSKTIVFTTSDIDGTVDLTTVSSLNASVEIVNNEIVYTPNENFYGVDTIKVVSTDNDGATTTKTIAVTVNSVNDLPTLEVVSSATVDEDDSVSITFTASDIDGTIASTTATSTNGTVLVSGDQVTYTPNENFNGTDTITLTSTDDLGGSVVKTIAITVTDINDAPTLEVLNEITLVEDTVTEIAFVASDAADIDGSIVDTTAEALNGSVSVDTNTNKITYTPSENYFGSDTITVTTTDDDGAKTIKTITLTITSENDLPVLVVDSTMTVDEDDVKTITFTASDVEGISSLVANATNGEVSIEDDQLTYTPNENFNGSDTIVITLIDSDNVTIEKTINVTVNDINDAPTLDLVSTVSMEEDGEKVIEFTAADVDGQYTVTITGAENGTATLNDTFTTITYIPDADFAGKETLTVTVTDDDNQTVQKTIDINVNDVNEIPTLEIISTITMLEDTIEEISFTASDIDGSVTTIAEALHGTANIVGNNVVYTPEADYTGSDTITVTTTDDRGAVVVKTVNVTVNEVNELPELTIVSTASTNEDEDATITFAASDSDGTVESVIATATKGTTSIANGEITYTPNENIFGSDIITVVVTDDKGDTVTKTVAIEINPVNDLPVIADVQVVVPESDGRVSIHTGKLEVSDADTTDTHTFAISNITSNNPMITDYEIEFDESGNYSLVGDFDILDFGNDLTIISFDYIATDNMTGQSTTETVSINITGANDTPIAPELRYEVSGETNQVSFEGALPGAKAAILVSNTETINPVELSTSIGNDIVNNLEINITPTTNTEELLPLTFNSLGLDNQDVLASLTAITDPLYVLVDDLKDKRNALPATVKASVIEQLGELSEEQEGLLDDAIAIFVSGAEETFVSGDSIQELSTTFGISLFDIYESSVTPNDLESISVQIQAIQQDLEDSSNSLVSDIVTAIETQIDDTSKTDELTSDVTTLLANIQATPENQTQLLETFAQSLFITFDASVTVGDLETISETISNLEGDIVTLAATAIPSIVTAIETQIGDTSKTEELTNDVTSLISSLEDATPAETQTLLEAFGTSLFTTFDASVTPTDLVSIQDAITTLQTNLETNISNATDALPSDMFTAIITNITGTYDQASLVTAISTFLTELEEENPDANNNFAQNVMQAYALGGTIINPADLANPNSEISIALASAGAQISELETTINTLTATLSSDIVTTIEGQIEDSTHTTELTASVNQLIAGTITTEQFTASLFTLFDSSVNTQDLTDIQTDITTITSTIESQVQAKIDSLPTDIVDAIETQLDDTTHTTELTASVNQLMSGAITVEQFTASLFTTFNSSVTPNDLTEIETSITTIQNTLLAKVNGLVENIVTAIETQLEDTSKTTELTQEVTTLLANIEATPEESSNLLEAFALNLFNIYDASVTAEKLEAIEASLSEEVDALSSDITSFPGEFTTELLESLGVVRPTDIDEYINDYQPKFNAIQFSVTALMNNALTPGYDLAAGAQNIIDQVIVEFELSIEEIIFDNLPDTLTTSVNTLITAIQEIDSNTITSAIDNPLVDFGVDISTMDFSELEAIKTDLTNFMSTISPESLLADPSAVSVSIKSQLDNTIADIQTEVDSVFTMTQEELNSSIVSFIETQIKTQFSTELDAYKAELVALFGDTVNTNFDALVSDMIASYLPNENMIEIDEIRTSIISNILESAGFDSSLIQETARAEFAEELTNDLLTSLTIDADMSDYSFVYLLDSTSIQTKVTDTSGVETFITDTVVVVNPNGSYTVTNDAFANINPDYNVEVSFNYSVQDSSGAISDPAEVSITLDISEDNTYTDPENNDNSLYINSELSENTIASERTLVLDSNIKDTNYVRALNIFVDGATADSTIEFAGNTIKAQVATQPENVNLTYDGLVLTSGSEDNTFTTPTLTSTQTLFDFGFEDDDYYVEELAFDNGTLVDTAYEGEAEPEISNISITLNSTTGNLEASGLWGTDELVFGEAKQVTNINGVDVSTDGLYQVEVTFKDLIVPTVDSTDDWWTEWTENATTLTEFKNQLFDVDSYTSVYLDENSSSYKLNDDGSVYNTYTQLTVDGSWTEETIDNQTYLVVEITGVNKVAFKEENGEILTTEIGIAGVTEDQGIWYYGENINVGYFQELLTVIDPNENNFEYPEYLDDAPTEYYFSIDNNNNESDEIVNQVLSNDITITNVEDDVNVITKVQTYNAEGRYDFTTATGDNTEVLTDQDDTIVLSDYADAKYIDALDGNDTLDLSEEDANLDLGSLLANVSVYNIENIDMSNDDNSAHILSNFTLDEFISLTDEDNTLKIFGDDADKIQLDAEQNWTQAMNADTTPYQEDGFNVYYSNKEDQSLKLLIEDTVTVENI
ncbi:MAG: hypothetical protein CL623_11795 [Arcobacter sp.]|nr:hypothetical protein [Arcobacter sp.]